MLWDVLFQISEFVSTNDCTRYLTVSERQYLVFFRGIFSCDDAIVFELIVILSFLLTWLHFSVLPIYALILLRKSFMWNTFVFALVFVFFFNILLALLYLGGLFFWQLRSLCRLMMFPVFHVNNEWHIDLKLLRWNACLWLRLMLFLDVFFQIAGLIWIVSFSWYLKCLTGYNLVWFASIFNYVEALIVYCENLIVEKIIVCFCNIMPAYFCRLPIYGWFFLQRSLHVYHLFLASW